MPKLPNIWSVTGPTPRPGLSGVKVGRAPLISRGEGLKELGRGIAEAGAGIAQMLKRRQGEATETERLVAQLQAQRALNALFQQESESEDYKGAPDRYRGAAYQAIEEAASHISDPRQRRNFILQMEMHSEGETNRLSTISVTRARQDMWNEDEKHLDQLANAAFREPKNANGYIRQIYDLIEQMRVRYHMSPIEAETMRRRWGSKVSEDVWNREIDQDPHAALERIKKYAPGLVPRLVGPEDATRPEEPREDTTEPETTTEPDARERPDETMREEGPQDDLKPAKTGVNALMQDVGPVRQASLDPSIGLSGGSRGNIDVGDPGAAHSLAEQRQIAFRNELQDPRVLGLLAANVEAEVGGESQNGKLGYLETVLNRALSRGYSVEDSMWKYGASITHDKMRAGKYSPETMADLRDLIALAMRGSNVSNYATGNESGKGHIKGTTDADISVNLGPGHERFVWEAPDKQWWSRMKSYGKVPSKFDEGGGFDQPGTAGIGFGGASHAVRMRSDDINFLEQRGGHDKGVRAPQFSPEMAARLRTAAEVYEQETGRRAKFGELSRGFDPQSGEPVQAGYYRTFLAGGGLAAPPGHSRHERGLAADIPSGPFLDWMHQNGGRFGIVFRLGDKDPVHAELAQDTRRVALPLESGQSGPVRIASLTYPGMMHVADIGTSTATKMTGTLTRERRQTIGDTPAQRVADERRPPATEHEAYVRAMQQGRQGTYTDPRTGRLVMGRQVAEAVNKQQGTTAVNTAAVRPDGYPKGDFKGYLQHGNIDLNNRPMVRLSDGNIATTRAFAVELEGKHVLLPTISQDGRMLTPQQAVDEYKRTGQYLGVFDTHEHANAYADALHTAAQQRYSSNPDARHETPRLPIDPNAFQHPGEKRPGDTGYDPYLSNMSPAAIMSGIRRLESNLAKEYTVPKSVSQKNALKLEDAISHGEINATNFKPVEDAYRAGINGDPAGGINRADRDYLKNMVDKAAAADHANFLSLKGEFMRNAAPQILNLDPQMVRQIELSSRTPGEKAQAMMDAIESGVKEGKITPEQSIAAHEDLYRLSRDIDRKEALITARGGDPTVLFQPGTFDKPNNWYLGKHLDGSPSPLDAYTKPDLMDFVRRGIITPPPQLDPKADVPAATNPPWRQRNETLQGYRQRRKLGELPSGPDPWQPATQERHWPPADPSQPQYGPTSETLRHPPPPQSMRMIPDWMKPYIPKLFGAPEDKPAPTPTPPADMAPVQTPMLDTPAPDQDVG